MSRVKVLLLIVSRCLGPGQVLRRRQMDVSTLEATKAELCMTYVLFTGVLKPEGCVIERRLTYLSTAWRTVSSGARPYR
jgi:hypothetical protein